MILIIALIILNLLLAPTTYEAALLTNEIDYQTLLSFKNHIVSDPFDVFLSWNDSVNFCAWTGVTCGKKHHRVTRLSLPSLQLAGPLSSSIGNLSFLRELNLNDNSFSGILPQEMGNLFRLERLGLSNNSFGGEFPKNNLSHLRVLSVLYVYGNNLDGKIPVELATLPKIISLDLGNNRFTGKIPRSFGNLSTLTELYFDGNDLHGDIPLELGQLPNLSLLSLSGNHLSGSIPSVLFNMSSIVILAVTQSNLSGILPSDMFLTLPNLQELYLGGNSFSGSIPSSISNASNLVLIELGTNSIVGSVPVNLGTSFHTLEVLSLAANQLGTEGGDDFRFITSLTNYTKLRVLGVGDNNLKGVLPNSVVNLSTKLTVLDLRQNVLSGTIPEGIGNLVNLESFVVRENELSGKIPDELGKLSNLNIFDTFQNNILGRIPSSLGNLTSLTKLFFGRNAFEGTIPATLGNCTSLLFLDLGENQLHGLVPQELLALSSLAIYLGLSGNNLTGPMSSQVGKLVNLVSLDLSENNMYGEIPVTLGNCLMLEELLLQKNNFSGSIPSSLKNLRSMKVFDLSQNNLSGLIPSFLVGMPLVEYLNLSFNMFEGEVPYGGIFNNRSAVSLVGNHKLCGGPSIWQFPPCSQRKKQGRRLLHQSVLVAIISTTITVCVCVIIAVLYRSRKSRHQRTTSFSTDEARYPRLSYGDLFQATDGFSSSNALGEGSFGVVYRGVLRSNEEGQIIAVKVLKLEQNRGAMKSFMAECEVLRNIRHRNLVKTITSCSSIDFAGNEFKALVFEFMPNGSLEKWLHPSSSTESGEGTTPRLSLLERMNIVIDIATALNYLHYLCHTPITHCDLKPNNVLLDNDMSARLSDFGLAKLLIAKVSQLHSQTSSTGIRGTLGYIAPEYGLGGEVSTHGDVYSFGILLLEIFTGKRPTDSMFTENFELREYVAKAVSEEGLLEVVDPTLLHWEEEPNPKKYEAMFYKCLAVVLQLGIACSAALPTARMDIGDAVLELQKARDLYVDGTGNRRRQ